MSPRRSFVPPLLALWVAACAEEPMTAVTYSAPERLDLALILPPISSNLFVTGEYVDFSEAPALVLAGEEPPESESDATLAETAIWDASTGVIFWPGRAEVVGEHKYIGNKGRVDITGTVRHDGVVLASVPGFKEQSHFFFNPLAHHIIGHVIINVEADCGLSADGKTDHSVWWEFAPGAGPSVFDKTGLTTFADREEQPPCEQPPVDYAGGDTGGGGGGLPEELTTDYTCYMWFTYDQETLEVLDIHATWCTGGG